MTNERAQRIVDVPDDESSTDSIAPPPVDRADQESELDPSLSLEDAAVTASALGVEDDSAEAEPSEEIEAPESLVEVAEDDDEDGATDDADPEAEPVEATDDSAEVAIEDDDTEAEETEAEETEADDAEGDVTSAEALPHLLEALLFVADEPIAPSALGRALERTPRQVRRGLDDLADSLREANRGVRLQQGPDGAQLVTAPEAANAVEFFLGLEANRRLSNAALETLAIIAYRQPVTRLGIEQIRGVSSDGAVATLRARGLIEGIGRAPGPGRPLLFSTTQRFLEHFGLERPDELPPLPADVELPPEEGGSQLTLEATNDEETEDQPTADVSEVESGSDTDLGPEAESDADFDEGIGDAEVIEDSLDDDSEFEPFGLDDGDDNEPVEDDPDLEIDDADLEISDDVDDLSRAAGAALVAAPIESADSASVDD